MKKKIIAATQKTKGYGSMVGGDIPPFENLQSVANEMFGNTRSSKWYKMVGAFVGFDGEQYVFLNTANNYKDASCIKYANFAKQYFVITEEMDNAYDAYRDALDAYYSSSGGTRPKESDFLK